MPSLRSLTYGELEPGDLAIMDSSETLFNSWLFLGNRRYMLLKDGTSHDLQPHSHVGIYHGGMVCLLRVDGTVLR